MKSEDILENIRTRLTALIGTAQWITVDRDRFDTRPFREEELPAVSIELGPSIPLGDNGPQVGGFLDSFLEVNVYLYVKQDSSTTKLSTALQQMYEKVYIELITNYTLDGNATNVVPLGWEDPVIGVENDLPVGYMNSQWRIQYRHLYNNPSA